MTHYHFDNQIQKKKISRKKLLGVIFGVVISAGVIIFGIASLVRTVARGPQWLYQEVQDYVADGVDMLTPKKKILQKNKELVLQIENYKAQVIELQMVRDENADLRTELSYIKDPQEVIFGRVLAKPSRSLYNSIIIDQGSRDGVLVGQIVVTQGFLGLGTVTSVDTTTATIALFSGPQFNDELVMKNQNITVPAKGKGGGNFEIHIPREIEVVDGDILALPQYPTIVAGVVKSIIFDPRDPFQTVLARTPVNIQELNFVEVLK